MRCQVCTQPMAGLTVTCLGTCADSVYTGLPCGHVQPNPGAGWWIGVDLADRVLMAKNPALFSTRDVLNAIVDDVEQATRDLETQPFNARFVDKNFSGLYDSVGSLARIVATLLPPGATVPGDREVDSSTKESDVDRC